MSEATARPLEDHDPCTDFVVAGERLTCDWAGCLFWPDEETLIVSDLHLEKGSSFARKGQLMPPYDTAATLTRLAQRLAVWQPKRVISLGDSFHDEHAHQRLPEKYLAQLTDMMSGKEWIWISGNHDPVTPEELGGKGAKEVLIGSLTFRHEPQSGASHGEISGHLHPFGKIVRRNRSVRRPCFVSDGSRMILPSFGAYTGGLNIRHSAFDGLFDQTRLSAVLLGKKRVFHISARNLVG
jgi:DNA ligase-associated metallophosphoesterase